MKKSKEPRAKESWKGIPLDNTQELPWCSWFFAFRDRKVVVRLSHGNYGGALKAIILRAA